MRTHLIALAALLLAPVQNASAEDVPATPADAALRIFNWCLDLPTGSPSECSCVAGYFAAATDEDEFQILSVAAQSFAPDGSIMDEDKLRADVFAMRDQLGIDEDRFNAIMANFATFEALGQKADAICVPIEEEAMWLEWDDEEF